MAKNNNRETNTLGHPTLAEIKAKLDKQVDKTVRTQDEIKALAARSKFAEAFERETEAALARARADDELLAKDVCPGSADPGSIVGLDDATPDSDAAGDGDSKRTDPNAG